MEEIHCEGSVVWYQLSGPGGYKGIWWPCKVVSTKDDTITLEAFCDGCTYNIDTDSLSYGHKVQPFSCSESREFVSIGRQRFKKKTSTLKEFLEAVENALDCYRSNKDDPTFTLDLDYPDLSSFNSTRSAHSTLVTPPHRVLSNSVFTTGGTTSPRITRSLTNKRPRPNYYELGGDPLKPVNLGNRRSAKKRQKRQKQSKDSDSDGQNSDDYVPDILTSQDINLPSRPPTRSPDSQNDSSNVERLLMPSPEDHVIISPKKPTKQLSVEIIRLSSTPVRSVGNATSLSATPVRSVGDATSLSATPVLVRSVGDATNGVSTNGYIEATPHTPPTRDKTNNHPQTESSRKTNSEVSPVPLLPSPFVDSFIQPGYDTMLEQIRDFSSDDDDDDDDVSSDSEIDDLPIVDFTVHEDIKLHEIRPNAVIWAKYRQFPFWPVLVVSVKKSTKKSKSSIQVKFLGYETTESKFVEVKIKNNKNIAPYATKRAAKFKKDGVQDKYSKKFSQAVEDAEKLITLRAGGEISGNPEEQLTEIVSYRPRRQMGSRSVSPVVEASHTPFMESVVNNTTPLNVYSATPACYDSSDEEDFQMSSSEGEEDNQEFEYNRAKVMEIVNEIECELVAIARGRAESHRHSVFVSGSEKERNGLKREGHYGPIMKWKSGKRYDFSQHLLEMVGKPEHQPVQCKLSQDYLLGVLLPEAMTRVIMRVEGVAYHEAEQKL